MMMMISMAAPANSVCALKHSDFPSQKLILKTPFRTSTSINPKVSSYLNFSTVGVKNKRPNNTRGVISATVAAEAATVEAAEDSSALQESKLEGKEIGVLVKPVEKPRLVLKFIWLEKNIGLALDQVIPGHGTIPLSPYYFWPRKDAWEELKSKLESKPWISQKRMIILLNQATDIINLWQQSGGNLS
ncbi:small ribosomal subunit protein cS23-like isoform X2 [Tasmannia lanceolata]|uniref:small ribosomal subunit protein cS23-like isoform X2 n=1 Tax=Tasmannia lanceolata TaxID=3420 RepID=UPI004063F615